MVETIGLSGDGGRRRTTIASCIAFAPGAVLGGIVTFGLLSALGELVHGVGGRAAYLVAAAIAIAAAVAEARGTRIVPQIRRQLPEQLAVDDADAARGGAVRHPARARVHHLRAQLRRLGAGGHQPRARRSGRGPRDRRGLRDRARAPGRPRGPAWSTVGSESGASS